MAQLNAPERLSVLRGEALSAQRDPTLQSIVTDAAGLADTPLAAITLIMGTIQYFRASINLPPDLDASLATSRCDSFCQFVVQSESSFVVNQASIDERVPQNLAKVYGVEAYLGVPVRIDGQVVGSLCVFDVKPREFSSELEAQMASLAARASARLDELARKGATLDGDAGERSAVVLAEELSFQARLLERALAEVGPLVRLGQAMSDGTITTEEAQRGVSVLAEASPMFQLLIDESRRMSVMSQALRERLGEE